MNGESIFESEAALDQLPALARRINAVLPENAVISLRGDLAAGKTTLVQALAEASGEDSPVTSPTFSLQHQYGERFFHYDLYRMDYNEIMALGLFEEFDRPGLHMVEWMGEELKSFLAAAGYNLFEIEIMPKGDRRIYTIRLLNA